MPFFSSSLLSYPTSFQQVGNYIQPLWEAIQPSEATEDTQVYNGAVEAATSLAGALLALAPGFVKV